MHCQWDTDAQMCDMFWTLILRSRFSLHVLFFLIFFLSSLTWTACSNVTRRSAGQNAFVRWKKKKEKVLTLRLKKKSNQINPNKACWKRRWCTFLCFWVEQELCNTCTHNWGISGGCSRRSSCTNCISASIPKARLTNFRPHIRAFSPVTQLISDSLTILRLLKIYIYILFGGRKSESANRPMTWV